LKGEFALKQGLQEQVAQLEQERDRLREENERLLDQVRSGTASGTSPALHGPAGWWQNIDPE